MNQPLKPKDLPHLVKASDIIRQKERESATSDRDQSKLEADDVDTGDTYDYEC